MPSRLNSGLCLRCGDKLIFGADDKPISGPYQCCSKCTDFIERQRYQVKKKVEQGKLNTKTVISSKNIVRPLQSMGPEVPGGVEFEDKKR